MTKLIVSDRNLRLKILAVYLNKTKSADCIWICTDGGGKTVLDFLEGR